MGTLNHNEVNDLIYKKALLQIAFNEAEDRAHAKLPDAGKDRQGYAEWRAWNLILKAVSREIAGINDELLLTWENESLYLTEVQRSDRQFLDAAVETVHAFYQDRLGTQDILMASAFDLARQAVKALRDASLQDQA